MLTARHCVVPPRADDVVTCNDVFDPSVAASLVFVTTDANLFKAKTYYSATEIITPTSTAFCGNDIALIVLDVEHPRRGSGAGHARRRVQDDRQARLRR